MIAAIKARLRDLSHDSGPAEEPSEALSGKYEARCKGVFGTRRALGRVQIPGASAGVESALTNIVASLRPTRWTPAKRSTMSTGDVDLLDLLA